MGCEARKMDMDTNLYSLSMRDYQSSTRDAFRLLKQDTNFLDVTLACEDGKQVKAHKVVLGSFSSVFQTILTNNVHPHPLLYLNGIEEQDIVNILDFIYLGEVKVAQSHVQKFLDIAEKFKINGLTDEKKNNSEMVDKTLEHNDDNDDNNFIEEITQDFEEIKDNVSSMARATNLESNDIKSEGDIENHEMGDESSVMTVDEEISELDSSTASIDHKRKFNCGECAYRATQSSSLKVHVMAKHQGIRFPCQVCDYKGSTKANTKVHMRNKHSL